MAEEIRASITYVSNLFFIACDLHGSTYILDLNYRQPNLISALQRELFKDTFAAVPHAIVLFSYPEDVGIKSAAYYRQHSWRIAALIYVNCALRTWYITSPAIKAMVAELVSALRASDLNNFWHEFPEVLVWVLFIGVIGAWDKLDRGWILLELRHGIGLLGLTSLEELEELLKSLLYPECMYAKRIFAQNMGRNQCEIISRKGYKLRPTRFSSWEIRVLAGPSHPLLELNSMFNQASLVGTRTIPITEIRPLA